VARVVANFSMVKPMVSSERRVGAAYWLGVAALCVIALASYLTMTRVIYTTRWAGRKHEALEELARVFSLVKDVQRGARGYVITGQEQFLKPYHEAVAALDRRIVRLRELASEEPARRPRLEDLERLTGQAVIEFKQMVELRRTNGYGDASEQVRAGRGVRIMEALGKVVNEWEAEEQAALARSAVALNGATLFAKWTMLLAALAGALRVGFSGWLFRAGIRQSEREAAALRRSEERFRVLAESFGDCAVVLLGPGGHIMSWNAAAERLSGYPEPEIIGFHYSRLYAGAEDRVEKCRAGIRRAVETGRFESEFTYLRKDGRRIPVKEVITTVRGGRSQVDGFIKISRATTVAPGIEESAAGIPAAARGAYSAAVAKAA